MNGRGQHHETLCAGQLGRGRQHKVEEPYVTMQEQQKGQEAAQALEQSQDEAGNSKWLWRFMKIKSSLEEIQAKAENNCGLG